MLLLLLDSRIKATFAFSQRNENVAQAEAVKTLNVFGNVVWNTPVLSCMSLIPEIEM